MSITSAFSSAQISRDDFLNLLVTQLRNQNPLEPTSSAEFASQLAQFSTLDELQKLNGSFSDMLTLQQLSGGSNLIGRTIRYLPPGAEAEVQGTVSSLGLANGKVQLLVNGVTVPLAQVTSVDGEW
jgi:flagellar basal-body rod modification protein FlgD